MGRARGGEVGGGWREPLRAAGRRAAGRALAARAFLPDLALVAVILVALWASIGLQLAREHDEARENAERTVSNVAGAAQQVISRTIEAVDQRLLFVRDAFRRDRLGFGLDFLRDAQGPAAGPTLQVAVIDAAGRLLMTSLGRATPLDLSDRAHFRAHLEHARDELFISVPVLGRESGRWSVQFTRKLLDREGHFAGVAVVSLDPYWLTRLYESLDIGRGIMVLAGTDGAVRARAPHLTAALGADLRGEQAFEAALRDAHGTLRSVGPLDGVERLVSHRRLPDHPLVVMVGRDVADIYADYERFRRKTLLAGAGLSALVLLAGGLMIGHKRRQRRSQRALSDALENISQGLIMVDRHGRVPVLNRRVAQLLGLPAALLAARPDFEAIKRFQVESGEFGAPGTRPEQVLDIPSGTPPPSSRTPENPPSVYERVRPDGTVLEICTQLLEGGGAVRTYADVTERRRAEERIRFLAHHDALTGLANRFALHERLEQALALSRRGEAGLAVLALDLDRFKAVNDTMGHGAGDLLLTPVAERLRGCARSPDTVARIGGDEFVVVQLGTQPAAAEALAARLVRAMQEPFVLDGQEAQVGTSIGIALPGAGATAEGALRDADTALYRAKSEGRGTVRVFEPGMGALRRQRRRTEQDLRRALEAGPEQAGLLLHFQPIFDRGGTRAAACEALLRWNHAERGAIPPGEFIPVAEESGLILPLGRWVLRAACAAAATWPGGQRVAVNLSPAQFRDRGLTGLVAETLRDSGLPADRLELEVTEGLLIHDTEQALTAMRALKAQGVRLTLDDFGTGFSSLAYLHRFPFDRVKVDRSFVAAVEGDSGARAIVGAILGMSAGLGLGTTAEGVETAAQLAFLDRQGCDELQGFLLARPMPAAELAVFLGAGRGGAAAGLHAA